MSDFPFAIVGFDLDGTLLDTSGDLAAAVNVALAEAGRDPLSADAVTRNVGGGAKAMLRQTLEQTGGCDEAEFRRLYKVMLAHYEAHIADLTAPYPGTIAALDALAARGVALAVVTNKFEGFAEQLLTLVGLRERFGCVIGGDTMGPGNAKPSPAPIHAMIARCGGGRAAFVGDSGFDIAAGRAAGVPTVAVGFGFCGDAAALGADAVIDGYDALVPTLLRLG